MLYQFYAQEVIAIHDYLVETYGGTKGIINLPGLESALARPFSGYYNSLHAQAAALMHGLIKNHAFVDGNKRTATAVTTDALDRSGVFIVGNRKFLKIDDWAEAIADNSRTQIELQTYFRRRMTKKRGRNK